MDPSRMFDPVAVRAIIAQKKKLPEWGNPTIGGNRADVMGRLFGWYYRIGKFYQLEALGGLGERNRQAEILRYTLDALLMEYLLDSQDVEMVRAEFIFTHPNLETHWTA